MNQHAGGKFLVNRTKHQHHNDNQLLSLKLHRRLPLVANVDTIWMKSLGTSQID